MDRIDRDKPVIVPPDKTVGSHIKRYMEFHYSRYKANDIGADEYDYMTRVLNAFQDWLGREFDVTGIDADKWEEWAVYVKALPLSVDYRKKHLSAVRSFIKWLASKGKLPALPNNLDNRVYAIRGRAKAIDTMTVDEAMRLVQAEHGQLRLHLLLMMNCGYTQKDIADLRHDEVDWSNGRITRKRSKTQAHDNVPVISYPLWPETFALLQRWRSSHPTLALTTVTGKTWLRKDVNPDTGKKTKTDNIKSAYVRLLDRINKGKDKAKGEHFTKAIKLVRKTSATIIGKHKVYGRFRSDFLGHAPRGMADRHYVDFPQDLFDEIVGWLGVQYGMVPGPAHKADSPTYPA